MTTIVGDRFQLLDPIGGANMGPVFQALDRATGVTVTVKLLVAHSDHETEAFLRLARDSAVLATLHHPNIAQMYGVFVESSKCYIVTELLEWRTLEEILAERQLSLSCVKGIVAQVAAALTYAQLQGVLHGALNPDTIFVSDEDEVKVTNFGLAHTLREGAPFNEWAHEPAGALPYIPPEVIEDKTADGRADIYSLGAILYRMTTGKPPFEGDLPITIAFHHIHSRPQPPSEGRVNLSPDWDTVILRALANDPHDRFPTAQAMAGAVSELSEEESDAIVAAVALSESGEITANSPHAHVLDDDVQFTVYRPGVVQPERWYTMLAFAHKSEPVVDEYGEESDPIELVRQQARAVLGEDIDRYQTAGVDSSAAIARGSELRFVPTVDGVEFNPPSRSFLWLEAVHREEFRLKADARLTGQHARGRLSVFFGGVLLAEVSLRLRVDSSASPIDRPADRIMETARPYRKIFASYSHSDLAVVEQFATLVQLLGDEFVRDWTHLRAGEKWNERLTEMIREADIFELFWSANSMMSPFVRQEWDFALSLGRQNFIRPVYWEDPLPCRPEQNLPPDELLQLHFQRLDFGVSPAPRPIENVQPPSPPPIAIDPPSSAYAPATVHESEGPVGAEHDVAATQVPQRDKFAPPEFPSIRPPEISPWSAQPSAPTPRQSMQTRAALPVNTIWIIVGALIVIALVIVFLLVR